MFKQTVILLAVIVVMLPLATAGAAPAADSPSR